MTLGFQYIEPMGRTKKVSLSKILHLFSGVNADKCVDFSPEEILDTRYLVFKLQCNKHMLFLAFVYFGY